MDRIAVYSVEVGRAQSAEWWRLVSTTEGQLEDPGSGGTSLDELVEMIATDLEAESKVALGFDFPLTVPLPGEAARLGAASRGSRDRAWSSGATATALGLGLQQLSWVLVKLAGRLGERLPRVGWDPHTVIAEGYAAMIIWEADVYGRIAGDGDGVAVGDARVAAEEFVRRLAAGDVGSDIGKPANFWTYRGRPLKKLDEQVVINLAGAALLRAGFSEDPGTLSDQPWVIRARRAAPRLGITSG
jgi:hypothetical protein